jgi:hypothetical protein
MPESHNRKLKSNFKIIAGNKAPTVHRAQSVPRNHEVRRWVGAPDDMPAGRYKAVCEAAARVTKYSRPMAELQFTVVDGEYTGVCLPGWIRMDFRAGKRLKPGCLYEKCCQMALETNELPDNLSPQLFVGKVFMVDATYARTDGKSRTPQDETVKKSDGDYLRVVKLVYLSGL